MKKYVVLMTAVLAIALVATDPADKAAAQSAAATATPIASPSASSSPGALDTQIEVNGSPVTLRDLIGLFSYVVLVYTPPKGAHPNTMFVTKPQAEMPSYDPDWHYAGNQTGPNNQPQLIVWTADRLGGKAPKTLMESTAVLGLLDCGIGGTRLQGAYAKARTADLALGANAADPWKSRRALAAELGTAMDRLMTILLKKQF